MALIRPIPTSATTIKCILPVTNSTTLPDTKYAYAIVSGVDLSPTLSLNGTALTASESSIDGSNNLRTFEIGVLQTGDVLSPYGKCALFYI